jgi:hypothetical protein
MARTTKCRVRQSSKRKMVIVLGMHRSGTSALCGALDLLGVNFGDCLMPSSEDNEKGYWEHPEISRLHDQLLRSFGLSWDDDRCFPAAWIECERARETQSSLLSVLRNVFRGAPRLTGLKDPRMCRLMPLWFPIFEALGVEPCFILIVRHPWEVAQSLAKRDSLDQTRSYLLWLQHTLEAEKTTRSSTRSFVSYERLLENPAATLTRIRKELKLDLDASSQVRGRLRNFLVAPLRHHVASVRSASLVPSLVTEAYRAFSDACASGDTASAIPALCSKYEQSAELVYSRLTTQEVEQASFSGQRRHKTYVGKTRVQVFAPKDGISCEDFSNQVEIAQNRWHHLKMELPMGLGDGSAPLRVDPADTAGILYLAAISIESPITKRVLWSATECSDLNRLRIGGTAFRLPHSELLRLFCYDNAPEIYLPNLSGPAFGGPLVLAVWLRFDGGHEAVRSAAEAWNEATSSSVEPAPELIMPLLAHPASKSTSQADNHPFLTIHVADESADTG